MTRRTYVGGRARPERAMLFGAAALVAALCAAEYPRGLRAQSLSLPTYTAAQAAQRQSGLRPETARRATAPISTTASSRRRSRASTSGCVGAASHSTRCFDEMSRTMPPGGAGLAGRRDVRAAARVPGAGERRHRRHARLPSDAAALLRTAMMPAAAGGPERRPHDRRGDSAAAPHAESARSIDAGHRRDAEQPARRRVAHVAPRVRRAGLQPARRRSREPNVGDLRLAWSWALPNGPNEVTPLVHDGVMFVHAYGDKVQALDAATGDLLWQYSRRLPRGSRAHREARHRALRRHDSTCRPPTRTWWRSTRRPATWCGIRRSRTRRLATA